MALCASLDLPTLADVVDYHPATASPEAPLTTVLPLLAQAESLCPLTCAVSARSPLALPELDKLKRAADCVVVVSQKEVLGILTQHDVIRLEATWSDLSALRVGEVMTRSPIQITASPQQTLFHVLSLLKQHHIHHLPVLDESGHLAGLVSAESIHQALQPSHFLQWRLVADAMATCVVQALPTASLLAVAQKMHRYQVSCVAITRRQNGQPEGLVTAGDLVQCLQLGCDFAKTSAQTLMSTPPFCTTSATTLWTAHQQMQQHCIHQLLVCDLHGNLQGIVTQTDVLQSMDPTELLSSIQALQQTVEQQNSTLQAMTAALQRQSSQQQQIKAQLKQTEASLAQDVTERKRTELALFASEERWQQLAEKLQLITANAPVCIYEINRSGQVTFANRIDPGIASGQILGNHLSNWFPLRQSHIIESAIAQVFQTHEIRAIAYEIPDSQGTAHAYETQVAPILIDGEVTSAVLIASDVTQRQQAEARLKEQAALIDIATDAILVRSLDDEVIFWSKGAERIYGWSAKAALGQSLNQLLNQKPSPELEAAWKTVLTQGEWQGELQKYTHSGKVLTIESRWTLVRDRAGNPQSILSVDTDITAKRQLEVQFLRAQRLESLGTLASGIAHDLNNLMTPILGIAHLLSILLKDADEKIQELLEIQLSSVRRGTALVKQILSFARGAEGKYTVMQLRHVINEVKAFSAKTFPKSISIQTDLARDLWTIQGDATHLHQVLMNLCVNARDAMLKGGSLMLSAENFYFDQAQAQRLLDAKPGPYIIVAVTDTGTGIPPEVVDRIFDPFFTTKVPGQGTGLGLSTAVGIVKSHGGFLTVSSQPGQGTQFKVYLPAIAAPLPVTTAEQPLPRGSQELILVVDDETPVCKTARTMLETYNYRVMTATEGTKAIAFYRQHHTQISAVLVDLMMPALDGFAVIRALQNIKPAVKVIALSGLATNQARLETEGAAVHAFLNKPYSLDDLLQTLHQVLHDLSPSKVET